MATYITKKCPHCGAIYSHDSYPGIPSKDNRTKYGSPIRKCQSCGTLFKDDDYREIAVDGIRPVDKSVISPYSILSLMVGTIVMIASIHYGYSWVWYILLLLFIFCFSPLSDVLTYRKRKSFIEQETIESEKRLCDPTYAETLKKLGYNVPEKYLPPSSDSQESSHE